MKYNPKVHEEAARLPGFAAAHPLQDDQLSQGALQIMYDLQTMLGAIAGLDAVSLQPAAGAQGEFAGILVFARITATVATSSASRFYVPIRLTARIRRRQPWLG